MNYTNKGRKQGSKRENRTTHYGHVVTPVTGYSAPALPAGKVTTTTSYPSSSAPKYAPVSDEVTVYGAKKFRTPWSKDEYTGLRGSKIHAYVLDIDGTLQDFGSSASKKVLDWCAKIDKADPKAVFLVITARDHGSFGYQGSFNWLLHAFPYPFIGPFARAVDDPRYASEFKRELAQGFEDMGLYQIMGAADDNTYVLDMWDQWGKDHFADPATFDVLRCDTGSYQAWRKDLPTKGSTGYPSYGGTQHANEHWDSAAQAYVSDFRTGQVWEHGAWSSEQKKYVPGYWRDVTVIGGKNRAAGTSRYAGTDVSTDPNWASYVSARQQGGAYLGEPEPALDDELQEILDQIDAEQQDGYALYRADLEAVVRHDFPGYAQAELDDMSLEELREHAGLTGTWSQEERAAVGSKYVADDGELFTAEQLGYGDTEFAGMSRQQRIDYRLDLEQELYAETDLDHVVIETMDLVALEIRLDEVEAQRRADERATEDQGAPAGGPATAPLDVAEVLRNLDGCPDCGLEEDLHKLCCPRNGCRVAGNAAQGVA